MFFVVVVVVVVVEGVEFKAILKGSSLRLF